MSMENAQRVMNVMTVDTVIIVAFISLALKLAVNAIIAEIRKGREPK